MEYVLSCAKEEGLILTLMKEQAPAISGYPLIDWTIAGIFRYTWYPQTLGIHLLLYIYVQGCHKCLGCIVGLYLILNIRLF